MLAALVAGGGGQLGRALAATLPDAAVLSRSELDITDRQAVVDAASEVRPQVIVNAAAFTKVDAAQADPDRAHRVNVEGARNLGEAAERVGALLVQVSTDYVYPGDKDAPYVEEDATGPLSVYGKTKLEGEAAAAAACSRALIVRTSWVFGEGQNFLRSIVAAASAGLPELAVVADQKGLPTYAPHLAHGIVDLVKAGKTGIFHLAGSGAPTTWAGLAEVALEAAGLGIRVKHVTTAEYAATRSGPLAPRPSSSVLDCSKAAALGVTLPPWIEAVTHYARQLTAANNTTNNIAN